MLMEAWKIRKNQVIWLFCMHILLGQGQSSGYYCTTLLNPRWRGSDFSICGRIPRWCHSSETCSWSFALYYPFCGINKKEMCIFLAIFTLTTVKSKIAGRTMIAWNAGEVHPHSVCDSFEIHSSPLTVNSSWGHLALTDTQMIRVGAKSPRKKVRITDFWNKLSAATTNSR